MGFLIDTAMSELGISFGNNTEYPVNSNKYFAIFGRAIISFSKVSGIVLYQSKKSAVNAGGVDEPYITTGAVSELSSLQLEKGYGTVAMLNILKKAAEIILVIKNNDGSFNKVYYSDRISVSELKLSDLNASKSEVLIQSLKLSYTYLKPLPIEYESIVSMVENYLNSANDTSVNDTIFENFFSDIEEQASLKVSEDSSNYSDVTKDDDLNSSHTEPYTSETKSILNEEIIDAVKINEEINEVEALKALEDEKAFKENEAMLEKLIDI